MLGRRVHDDHNALSCPLCLPAGHLLCPCLHCLMLLETSLPCWEETLELGTPPACSAHTLHPSLLPQVRPCPAWVFCTATALAGGAGRFPNALGKAVSEPYAISATSDTSSLHRLRKLGLFCLEEKRFCGDLVGLLQYWKGPTRKLQRDFSSGTVVVGREGMASN